MLFIFQDVCPDFSDLLNWVFNPQRWYMLLCWCVLIPDAYVCLKQFVVVLNKSRRVWLGRSCRSGLKCQHYRNCNQYQYCFATALDFDLCAWLSSCVCAMAFCYVCFQSSRASLGLHCTCSQPRTLSQQSPHTPTQMAATQVLSPHCRFTSIFVVLHVNSSHYSNVLEASKTYT